MEPFTREEYEWLLYGRKSLDYSRNGVEDVERWRVLYERFYAHFPHSVEREAWHEAGHVVVAHRLGGVVVGVRRDAEGPITDIVAFEPPFVPLEMWAALKTAGYLTEERATGHADPHEASEICVEYDRRVIATTGANATHQQLFAYVERVEGVVHTILDEHWDAVETVTRLVRAGLPIDRATLLPALEGVPNGGPVV